MDQRDDPFLRQREVCKLLGRAGDVILPRLKSVLQPEMIELRGGWFPRAWRKSKVEKVAEALANGDVLIKAGFLDPLDGHLWVIEVIHKERFQRTSKVAAKYDKNNDKRATKHTKEATIRNRRQVFNIPEFKELWQASLKPHITNVRTLVKSGPVATKELHRALEKNGLGRQRRRRVLRDARVVATQIDGKFFYVQRRHAKPRRKQVSTEKIKAWLQRQLLDGPQLLAKLRSKDYDYGRIQRAADELKCHRQRFGPYSKDGKRGSPGAGNHIIIALPHQPMPTAAEADTIIKQYLAEKVGVPEPPRHAVAPRRPRRRIRSDKGQAPLSPRQLEAAQLFGEHKGNKTAAAAAMGISRAALDKLLGKAQTKLGKNAVKKIGTAPLPMDGRGQAAVSASGGRKIPGVMVAIDKRGD
jgi:predicted DNA-binding protein (UPF0251 family)